MTSLKVILNPCRSPGILSAKMWIREGSRADPKNRKGIHNILGSLLTRGCGPYNHIQIADIVEGSGAALFCETYEDGLMVSLKCTENKSSNLIPIFNWMITEPRLHKSQLDLERNFSIQSILRQRENPFTLTFNQWRKGQYPNHPYNHEILGNIKDLKKISREDIISLSSQLITREKTIVISGSLPNDIEKHLSNLNELKLVSDNKKNKYKRINKNLLNKKIFNSILLNPLDTNQIIFILGNSTIPHAHPDDLALRILSCHLGSGMSSLLFKLLREENGLSYDVGTYYPIRELESPFIIHASSSKEKSMSTLICLKESWERIQSDLISEEELKLAKVKFCSNISHNSQTISQRTERKAHLIGLLMKEDHDIDILSRVKSITREDIQLAACRHLKNPLLSLSGPEYILNKLAEYWIK